MKTKTCVQNLLVIFLLFCLQLNCFAQDSAQVHIDPSKPSNLYTRVSNNLEYTFRKGGNNTYGYRANFVWASKSKVHAIHIELPLLYSTASKKFGLSDMRFRYFWVPYKNYSRKPSTFGGVFESYMPTGNRENALGSGRWIISPGITTGFVFHKFSTFPILSYQYTSSVANTKVPNENTEAMNGFTIQSICVYNFNKKSYLDCTPVFIVNKFSDASHNDFRLEGNYLYMVKKNRLQVGCFARKIFKAHVTTIRASVRMYF